MVNEYVFSYLCKTPKIGVERSEYCCAFIQLRTGYLTQSLPYLVHVFRIIELGRQLYSTVNYFLYFEIFRVIQPYGFPNKTKAAAELFFAFAKIVCSALLPLMKIKPIIKNFKLPVSSKTLD